MPPSTSQQRRQISLPRRALGRRAASQLPTLLGFAPSPSPTLCKEARQTEARCADRFVYHEQESVTSIEEPATPDMSPSAMLDSALEKSQNLLDELLSLHIHDDKSRIRAHISFASFHFHDENGVSAEQPTACVSTPKQTTMDVPEDMLLLRTEMLADNWNKRSSDEDSVCTCSTDVSSHSSLRSPALSVESPGSFVGSLDSSSSSIGPSASRAWVWPSAKSDPTSKLSTANHALSNPSWVVNSSPRPVPVSEYLSPRSPLHRGLVMTRSPQRVVSAMQVAWRPVAVTSIRHVFKMS